MEEKRKSGFSVACLVLGIIGVCTSFIPILNNVSFILGLIGIEFGIVSLVKKSSKVMSIVGIIICVLAIVFTICAQNSFSETINDSFDDFNESIDQMSGNKTEEILANYADVSIGSFEVIDNEYYTDTKLNVKVTNKSSEKKSFNIHIEAVDSTGARLDDGYVNASDLTAGQSQDFEIFTLVSSDKIETIRNATFKIVDVSMY